MANGENSPVDWVLPQGLTLEIFYRLPLKSLGRVKLVSKSWNSLISSHAFVKSYAKFSSTNNKPIMMLNHSLGLSKIYYNHDDYGHKYGGVDVTSALDLELIFLDNPFPHSTTCHNSHVCEVILGSCDGLICVFRNCIASLYVLNPTTKQCRKIPLPHNIYDPKRTTLVTTESWFGFVSSINDYKIVLFTQQYDQQYDMDHLNRNDFIHVSLMASIVTTTTRIHLLSVKDVSKWRELDADVIFARAWLTKSVPAFMNEALHYYILVCIEPFGTKYDRILKFDLVRETLDVIPLETKKNEGNIDEHKLQTFFGVIDDKICCWELYVMSKSNSLNVDLEYFLEKWALNQYGKWDTWEKILRIDLDKDFGMKMNPKILKIGEKISPSILGFTCNGKVLMRKYAYETDSMGHLLVVVDTRKDPPTYYQLKSNRHFGPFVTFIRSILSPFIYN